MESINPGNTHRQALRNRSNRPSTRAAALFLALSFMIMTSLTVHGQSGNLKQARNGAANSPVSPVDFVNGNAGSSNSHFLESMSVPYRYVITGLAPGTHTLIIEYDIKKNYNHAIDYITHYNRLEPHDQFSHSAEVIDLLGGLPTVDPTPFNFPIPVPVSNKVVTCTGLSQPATSFNSLPASERMFTMFNGDSITDIQYLLSPDLNASDESQRLQITFVSSRDTVVLAWGGHIAAAFDWCPEYSAAGISGSGYHMALKSLDGSGGNSDLSLSTAAVIPVPPCEFSGEDSVCTGQTMTYSVDPYVGYTYTWSLANNTAGASITSSNVGTSITLNTGASSGSFIINVEMTITGYSGICSKEVLVGEVSLSETHVDYSCSTNTGSVDLTPSGGFPPYSFQWSNGQITEDLSGLSAGTYSVTVTDRASCTAAISVTIDATPTLSASVTTIPVACHSGSTGSANTTVSGGTLPYSFTWSNGSTSQNISGISAGTYTIIITDANGCSKSITAGVSQPGAALSAITTASPNVSCFGGTNGSVNLFVSGGTSPYTFLWSKGSTTQNIDNLSAGTYTVTITDANGCTLVQSHEITQPTAPLTSSISSSQNVSCHGGTNASITLLTSGGTPSYSYQWNNGSQTQNLTSIPAGTYTVTVTDTLGCTSSSTISVTEPPVSLSATSSSPQAVSCFGGSNGAIDLTVTGGTPAYSYNWSNGNTVQDLTGLAAGSYTVTITDANGCTYIHSSSVSQPASALSTNINIQQVSCFGWNNGEIDLTVNGGTTAYTYNWSNGSTTEDINGLAAGTYSVTVTDANGCTSSESATISQPAAPLSGATQVTSNISCFSGNNGSIDLTATGGTAPYSYAWNTGANTEDISNLSAGIYIVTITDANSCTFTVTDTITQPAGALSTSIQVTQGVLCYGGNDGNIDLTVTGGTPPYAYTWSNGATTEDIQSLSAGVYTATITDVNGCSASVTGTITEPSQAISASANATQQVNCFGGSNGTASLSVVGGTPPYTYLWSNGSANQNQANLAAGSYSVTVTDANGCTDSQSITITQPAASLASAVSATQNVNCFGGTDGSIDLSTSGGTPPYTYNWSNGATTEDLQNISTGTYNVTITDANGCLTALSVTIAQPSGPLSAAISASQNVLCFGGTSGSIDLTIQEGTPPYTVAWSNGSATEDLSGLPAGTYTATITDANGCTATATTTIQQPSGALSATIFSSTPVNCYAGSDGTIDITVTQGTPPYTFAWNNGAGTEDLTGLSSGTYTVVITDANGCTTSLAATITQPAATLAASVSSFQNVSCFAGSNGAVSLTVNGGTSPYTYQWSNGNTSQNIANLQAGNYTVIITDVNGCTATQSASVSEPLATLSSSISASQNINCHAGTDGSIGLTVSGGTTPYSYSWSNGATTKDLSGLTAGTYTVNITDANGCTSQQTLTLNQPLNPLSGTASVTSNISCFSGNNGSIDLTVNGGTPPYAYLWNTGSPSEDLSGLAAGTYTVTVTDANGCTYVTSATITQPPGSLTTSVSISQNVSCHGGSNGSVNLTASSGTPPYTFLWSNGATTEDINNLPSGTYTVTVNDANGCLSMQTVVVSQPAGALSATLAASQNVNCYAGSDGSIDLTVSMGTPPYSFNWSGGQTTQNISGLASGNYSVIVTDTNGCTDTLMTLISQPAGALNATVSSSQNVGCFADSTGNIDLTVVMGTPPYSYAWNTGDTTEDISNLPSGNYSVTVTDANGCVDTLAISISQPAGALSTGITVLQQVSCYNGNNGALNLTVTQGTPPYNFNWSTGAITEDIDSLTAGTYTVTVTDANGCSGVQTVAITQPNGALSISSNVLQQVSCHAGSDGQIDLTVQMGTPPYSYSWSNGMTTEDIMNLQAGTYTVIITDSNGCTDTHSVTITQPAGALNATLTMSQPVSCYGGANGAITVNTSMGTAPYSYQWSSGDTTKDISSLPAGTYAVTITDANGCTLTDSVEVTQPAGALSVGATVTQQVSCHNGSDGSIDLTVTQGTPPYTYTWSHGASTEDVSGLPAGSYTVTVTDANGCTVVTTASIIQPPASVMVTGTTTPSNCLMNTGGSATANPSGGTAPYQYQWSQGGTIQQITNLPQGTYTVTVTDDNGCTSEYQVTVGDISEFHAKADGPTTVCVGDLVTLLADSIDGATYQWYLNGQILGGATYPVFVTPAAGFYSVSISHPCGEFHSDTIEVNVQSMTNVSLSPNVIICPGESTQLSASGGASYLWSPATGLDFTTVSNPIASPTLTTSYNVEITSEHGCKTNGQVIVTVMCDTLIIPSGYSPNDDGINDAFVIKGIEHYPGNMIWIYNRWGNLVYKARSYKNNWDGLSNVTGIYIGKRVPAGTYFYVLNLGDGTKPRTGYIVLRK